MDNSLTALSPYLTFLAMDEGMLLGSKICTALMMLVAGNLSLRELMISDTNSVTLLTLSRAITHLCVGRGPFPVGSNAFMRL